MPPKFQLGRAKHLSAKKKHKNSMKNNTNDTNHQSESPASPSAYSDITSSSSSSSSSPAAGDEGPPLLPRPHSWQAGSSATKNTITTTNNTTTEKKSPVIFTSSRKPASPVRANANRSPIISKNLGLPPQNSVDMCKLPLGFGVLRNPQAPRISVPVLRPQGALRVPPAPPLADTPAGNPPMIMALEHPLGSLFPPGMASDPHIMGALAAAGVTSPSNPADAGVPDERLKQMVAMYKALMVMNFLKTDSEPVHVIDGLFIGSVGAAFSLPSLERAGITHILCVASGIRPRFPENFTYRVVDVLDAPSVDLTQYFDDCHRFIDGALQAVEVEMQDSLQTMASEKTDDRDAASTALGALCLSADSDDLTSVLLAKEQTEQSPSAINERKLQNMEAEMQPPAVSSMVTQTTNRGRRGVLVHCFAGRSRSSTVVISYLMRRHKWSYETALQFLKAKRAVVEPNEGFARQLRLYEQRLVAATANQKTNQK